MAIYAPCRGGRPDGLCSCGATAVTEIQCGWVNGPTAADSGGQYEEMCQACWYQHVQDARESGQCYPDGTPYAS